MNFSKKRLYLVLMIALNIVMGIIIAGVFYYEVDPLARTIVQAGEEKRARRIDDKSLSAMGLQRAFNEIARANLPAVVSLQVETLVIENRARYSLEEEFLRRFFEIPQRERKRRGFSYGSGFVISEDGYLISNFHVVKNAQKIIVIFKDSERKYEARLIGADEDTDVALLKIKKGDDFPYVAFGDSDRVEIGDLVVAIGNPFGLSHTLTTGVISAKGRNEISDSRYQNYIQTDVAINPGNSGGPLINLNSEVIGINSMIYSGTGNNVGIGFAIPINMVKGIVKQLKKSGKVTRGYLGVSVRDISAQMAESLAVEQTGAYIVKVIPQSPAARGNIKSGDIILSFNEKKIKNASDLINQVGLIPPESIVNVRVLRKRTTKILKIKIGSQK